jgi:hypothetical protein
MDILSKQIQKTLNLTFIARPPATAGDRQIVLVVVVSSATQSYQRWQEVTDTQR